MISSESRLLIIDTSTNYLSLGIHQNGYTHSIYEAVGAKQSELILPRIQQLLDTASLTLAQLDAIVYAQGPGAFTGLRIGLGVATGLALPNNLPLIGIPCLDAVAALAPSQPCVLAATDARMNELFFAWYDTQNHKRLSDYLVGSASSIQLPADQHTAIGIGNAYALDIILPVSGQNLMPGAQEYAQLALSGRYIPTNAAHASLHYVRNKIALTAAEQAARRAAGQTA
ncbi:tRNA (adenosine(37)-N6)-threonylcarbamoyltransferase complex dimerization subunit type 1 TsaB [Snodgrassella alvi]|uniref:tRNA (adenosine(37)-N6)-threonylcarbamoyltransferase complex dimerization subunit type 1 TsaB n=1 Tax=Snodgrassella alvi TaxID=1196083 RepID=UPI000C1DEFAF|nr:tRNA (adenosine(37)-N6)-threonylcarbamoyltransferase complex dimerization subunit type 1 TsaB [Snodgrassella alvi]PIT16520.1 tRNA (adenosine(37)-N6)-threonylcarbamoyltransferase complex dimerization subunit type 1 TsaB [Snodgrassella alvi]PIT18365.1 tRNA (adenosine(37)-N6)-threonylcarbamoyltransferase complex dimerization subunit type 1 TsaB [Snodgrassella alvi]